MVRSKNKKKLRRKAPHAHRYTLRTTRPHHLPNPNQPERIRIINHTTFRFPFINQFATIQEEKAEMTTPPSSREYFVGSPQYDTPRG